MFATSGTPKERSAEPNVHPTQLPEAEVQVLVRGDHRTYELRDRLRAAGMHWLPQTRAWSGTVPESFVPQMQAEGLQVVPVVPEGHPLDRFLDSSSKGRVESAPARKPRVRTRREPAPKPTAQDMTAAFLPAHGWTEHDITANLADDGRAEDERRVARHLRDLRERVKAVRGLLSTHPDIAQTLATCPEKARAFSALHGVSDFQVKHGVPEVDLGSLEWDELADALRGRFPGTPSGPEWVDEEVQRANSTLPESGEDW